MSTSMMGGKEKVRNVLFILLGVLSSFIKTKLQRTRSGDSKKLFRKFLNLVRCVNF